MSSLSEMTTSDWIQASLALITFLAVLVALFEERFWRWLDRPRLNISFDKSSERCLRWAIVSPNNVQEEGQIQSAKKHYFRLQVINNGSVARNLRARADILDKDFKALDRFEPTLLNWINSRDRLDLARGESEYVNLISQMTDNPVIKRRLTVEIFDTTPRGIAWDRLLKPYVFEVTIYGDNFKPVKSWFSFTPHKDKSKIGELQKIHRTRNLISWS